MNKLIAVSVTLLTLGLSLIACNSETPPTQPELQDIMRIGIEANISTGEVRYLTTGSSLASQATEVLSGPSTTGFTFSYAYAGGAYMPSGTTSDTGSCQASIPMFDTTNNLLTLQFCFENQSTVPYQKLLYRLSSSNTNVVSATHNGVTLDSTNFTPGDAQFDANNNGTLAQNEATQAQIFVVNYTGNNVRFFVDVLANHLVINEVDANAKDGIWTDGGGNIADVEEFVELYDGGVGNTDLSGHTLNFYDGTTDASYHSVNLNGISTNINGYALICMNNEVSANCDLDLSGAFQTDNFFQDGTDALGLYYASSVANGTAVTTNNLLDAFVYDTDDADDANLLNLLNPGQTQVNENATGNATTQSNSRCANGSGGARNTASYIQRGPTPGIVNDCPDGSYNVEVRITNLNTLPTSQQGPVQTGITNAETKWENVITGDILNQVVNLNAGDCGAGIPAVNETIDDILIFIKFEAIDGPGGTLAAAGPCIIRSGTQLVALGSMTIDSGDIAGELASGSYEETVLHEMGHILGIGSLWGPGDGNFHAACPDTDSTNGNMFYTGAQAVAKFTEATPGGLGQTGQPLIEETGGSGTACSHWDEGFFDTELMTGYSDSGANALSSMTIGSLADLGLTVDYSQAEAYTVPGCAAGLLCTVSMNDNEDGRPYNDIILLPKFDVDPDGTLIPLRNSFRSYPKNDFSSSN